MSLYIDTVGDFNQMFGFYPSRITYFDKKKNVEETIYKDGSDYSEIEKWLIENDDMEIYDVECVYQDGGVAFLFVLTGNHYGYEEEENEDDKR